MEWKTTDHLVQYEDALRFMEQRVADIHDGATPESVWLLEHPHLYTAGTSANDADLLRHDLPVFQTGRGGQYTYHGPGQRVGYVMLNLRQRQVTPDIKRFVWQLEEWIIRTLACLGVKGERREGRVGIWVDMAPYGFAAGYEAKIAAIGVRIRRWVSFHGIAINVDPDLSMFNGIVPCGISQHGVTSLKQLGFDVEMSAFDDILKQEFLGVFGNDNTASHERLGAERV